MTVTDVAPETATTAPSPVVLFDSTTELLNALTNALLFTASKVANVPVLRSVRFERDSQDKKLTLVSTDRYRLFTQTIEHRTDDTAEIGFLLGYDEVKHLISVLKSAGKNSTVMLVVHKQSLKVMAGDMEITLRYAEGSYPKWRGLIPNEDAQEITGIAFGTRFLGDLGKLKLTHPNVPVRFQFFGRNKPALLHVDQGPTILHMPVRISA